MGALFILTRVQSKTEMGGWESSNRRENCERSPSDFLGLLTDRWSISWYFLRDGGQCQRHGSEPIVDPRQILAAGQSKWLWFRGFWEDHQIIHKERWLWSCEHPCLRKNSLSLLQSMQCGRHCLNSADTSWILKFDNVQSTKVPSTLETKDFCWGSCFIS